MATPLHYVAFCGIHDVLQVLIVERSQNVNAVGFDTKETPLGEVSRTSHSDVVQVLLDNSPGMKVCDKEDWNPLDWASREGHVDAAKVLLERGADVNAHNNSNRTPPYTAS